MFYVVTSNRADRRLTEQASHWFVLMSNPRQADSKLFAEFARWLRKSPRHVAEIIRLHLLSRALKRECHMLNAPTPKDSPAHDIRPALPRQWYSTLPIVATATITGLFDLTCSALGVAGSPLKSAMVTSDGSPTSLFIAALIAVLAGAALSIKVSRTLGDADHS